MLSAAAAHSGEDFEWAHEEEEPDKEIKGVFDRIDTRSDGKIDVHEMSNALRHLGITGGNGVAQELLWEVDEDLSGFIHWEEFKHAYKRAAEDKTGKEPRKMYNVIEFMMADEDDSGTLTVSEALECYGKRYGTKTIDQLVRRLFTVEERTNPSAELTFSQYCERDAIFLADMCKRQRSAILGYGRCDSKRESSHAIRKPPPPWRAACGPLKDKGRSKSSLGIPEEDARNFMLSLGLPVPGLPAGKARRGRRGRPNPPGG